LNNQGDDTLAARLARAWQDGTQIDAPTPECAPADAKAAFAVQHELLAKLGAGIGGWKVGAKSADGPIQGAPLPIGLPIGGCLPGGVRLARRTYAPLGLELEIAFRFGRVFEPRDAAYPADEVQAAIGMMAATIEIVASRYLGWPKVDKLAQLADLQNHGALVIGEAVPYRGDFAFGSPSLRFRFDDDSIAGDARPVNPAGDPRRLLPWLVNHSTQTRRIAVTPDMTVTTGSYSGMFFPDRAGVVRGTIDGLPPVSLELF